MSNYLNNCIKRLIELKAPLKGWECRDVVDLKDAEFTCELCGYRYIRYVHVMRHLEWPDKLRVGCVCDGTLSGDMLLAKKRDKDARLKSYRKATFLSKEWSENGSGLLTLNGRRKISAEKDSFRGKEFYKIRIGTDEYQWYKNRRLETLSDAKLLAFEIVEHERKTN